MALDFCVGSTALDAVECGFSSTVVLDCARAVDEKSEVPYPQPPESDQISFFAPLTRAGAGRNPVTFGNNQGDWK